MTALYLHLGAHRTGSTVFQRIFKRNHDRLAAAGVGYLGPGHLRETDYFYLDEKAGFDAGARERFAADRDAAGGMRLVLSEENILGSMRLNLQQRRFYPKVRSRLVAYAGLFGQAPARVGLALRGYAGYWGSAYSYLLPAHNLPPFENLASDLAGTARGWLDVITDIRAVFPEAEIVVWRLEDMQDGMRPAVAAFIDRPVAQMRDVARRINESPGIDAIPLIRAIRAGDRSLNGAEVRARLASAPAPVPGSVELFSEREKVIMAKRYGEDWKALTAGFAGARLLAPAGRAA